MKFLKQPVTPFRINQYFGDDMACVNSLNTKTIFKKTEDTCPIGYQSLYAKSGMKGHNALDLMAKHGQPVYASCEGYVEEVQTEPARGLGLGIVTENTYPCDELNGQEVQWKVRYWHLKSFEVKKGDKVKQGDLIGYADNTGYSSGDHLHLEIKPVRFVNKQIINILQDNGFYGAVNPLPYIIFPTEEEQFHLDHPELSPEINKETYTFRQKLYSFFVKLFTKK